MRGVGGGGVSDVGVRDMEVWGLWGEGCGGEG